MNTVEVLIQVPIKPTESPEKVTKAVENIFPDLDFEWEKTQLKAKGGMGSLKTFHRLLREQRILDTARSVLFRGRLGDAFQFRLNKQAATVGKINFPSEEEPLGSIHVQIIGSEMLIDWLAPQTVDGKPIEEVKLEDYV